MTDLRACRLLLQDYSFLIISLLFSLARSQSSDPTTTLPESTTNITGVGKTISTAVIVGIVISAVVAISSIGALVYFFFWLHKRSKEGTFSFPSIHIGSRKTPSQVPASGSSYQIEVEDRLQRLRYTYADVLDITKNLKIKLGEGGFGSVYFGELKEGSQVAVKILSSSSAQGTREFLNEVDILSRAHHKNLVTLVGYCCEANERCLIYEFLSKGTLEEHLHGRFGNQEPLSWLTRLRIAVGAAKGFNYLHNDCSPPIIHRDVKCSNILLDNNLTAKVGDFGLSKLLSESALTHVSTGVKGTFGYLDPEYAQTERLTEKSDVYSFGVILLELLTGKKAIMHHEGEYMHIAHWARPYIITKSITNILDKTLEESINKNSVQTVADMAIHCVASKSMERPSFQQVLEVLESMLKLELPTQAESQPGANTVIDIETNARIVGPTDSKHKEETSYLLDSVQKSV